MLASGKFSNEHGLTLSMSKHYVMRPEDLTVLVANKESSDADAGAKWYCHTYG